MKNNFDDLLREKWEEKYFPVDDHHRQQMLDLLKANDRWKKGIFWWFGGLVLAVTIGGIIVFMNQDNTISVPSTPAPVDSTKRTDEFAQIPEVSLKETNKYFQGSDQSAEGGDGLPQITSENSQGKNNDLKSSDDLPKIANSHTKGSSNHASITNIDEHIDSDSNKGTIFPAAKNFMNNDEILIRHVSPAIISETIKVVVNASADELEDSGYEFAQRNTFVTLPLESLFFSDLTSQYSNIIGYIKPSFSNLHSLRLFAEAGAGYVPAVKQEYSSGWNFMAGGGLLYKLGPKTNLLLSTGYMLQDGGFNFERTSTVEQAGFGTRSNFNALTPDKLHFIYSKLGVQYEVRRHLFSVHGGIQWLYGAQGTIVINTEDQLTGTSQSSQYTWLKMDGMRRFLWNGEALYGYRVTPRMSIRAGVKYYFSSIEANSPDLAREGYYWNGHYSTFTPSFIINYHLYGNR